MLAAVGRLLYHGVSRRIGTIQMPLSIDGRTVYRIGEALKQADVSRATFFRWIKDGKIRDTQYKDRNGRRVFTAEELDNLKDAAGKLIESPQLSMPLKFRL